jgi:ACS family glucarate transporter-like MFS transporter
MSATGVRPKQRATRKRYGVVAMGFALSFITYLDRAAIGQAAPAILKDLQLSPVQMGYVFSVFGFAYAAFELPSGWLGDWMGPRKVLLRIVLWWSFFTAATAWTWNYVSLLVTRFLFGVGEAGCFPNLAKAYSTWLPSHERLHAEGFKAASARWGGAVTPVLFVTLQQWLGWRGVFEAFALVGVVWAVGFYVWFRDDPREMAGVNEAELRLIGTGSRRRGGGHPPWRAFLHSRSAWLLWLNWFCYSYGFYFYLTWLPTYLQQAHRLDLKRSAVLAGLPLLSAGMGSVFSGYVCAWLMKTRRVALVRRTMAITGYAIAAAMLLLFTRLQDPTWIMTVLTISSFAAEFCGPVSWTTCMDLGGNYVGSLAGAMNTLGQTGGAVAPAVIGYILKWTNYQWSTAFYVSAAVYCCGILCWSFLDPVTPLDPDRTNL